MWVFVLYLYFFSISRKLVRPFGRHAARKPVCYSISLRLRFYFVFCFFFYYYYCFEIARDVRKACNKNDDNKSRENAHRGPAKSDYSYVQVAIIYGWHGNYIIFVVAHSRPARVGNNFNPYTYAFRRHVRTMSKVFGEDVPTSRPSPSELFRAGLEWLTAKPNARNALDNASLYIICTCIFYAWCKI